jgi:hypothetical protein
MRVSRRFVVALVGSTIALYGLIGVAGVASAGPAAPPPAPDDVCQSHPEASGTGSTASSGDTCVNNGDADASVDQQGSASSGDAVAGQVVGVVAAGDVSIDARNRSDDVSVTTGNVTGSNSAGAEAFAGIINGLAAANDEVGESEPEASGTGSQAASGRLCVNNGDASASADQSAEASSGDAVGGQVIGVVTSAGGSADLVLDNESTDSDVSTGEATTTNDTGSDTIRAETGILFFDVVPVLKHG